MKRTFLFILIFISLFFSSYGQIEDNRLKLIENEMQTLSIEMPGLNEKIELSVSDINIQEFLRAIANTNKINIYIDPSLDMRLTNNFSNVSVSSVLLFLCKQYDLDITFFENILSITKYKPIVIETSQKTALPKPINIKFNNDSQLINMDLSSDSLAKITREVTRLTGKNIIFPPDIADKLISFYIENVTIDNAIEKMALSNGLSFFISEDGFYFLDKQEVILSGTENGSTTTKNKRSNKNSGIRKNKQNADYEYFVENGNISLYAQNTAIADIINDISKEMKKNYVLNSDIQGNITTQLSNVSYEKLMEHLFNGSKYTISKYGDIYIIGERQQEMLRQTRIIQLQHRSISNLLEQIPKELQKDVTIKEFAEQNSFIICGSKPLIDEIEVFLRNVDKVVPVILIEVIIVSSNIYHTVNTGIKAGLGESPATTSFLFSNTGIQTTLNSNSINDLISRINGFSSLNLGKVTPNFYLSLSALEEQGVIKIHSTPRLATLNSHEATLVMGETEYYKEIQNTVVGTQNPQNIQSYQYKSISADLSVSIKPMFSGDDQITLEIKVEQSGFKKNQTPEAPPGSENKSFNSIIRVKNEEMILLGGLEEKSHSNTGSGLPLLARIPVLKWLFSSREKEKKDSQLNIFIKPTILL